MLRRCGGRCNHGHVVSVSPSRYTVLMTAAAPQRTNIPVLAAAIAAIAACDIAMGLTLQLLPLIMEKKGLPAWLIGLNTAMGPLGILVAGPFIPRLVARHGARSLGLILLGLTFLCLLLFAAVPDYRLWFPVRFMTGVAAGGFFTISEALVISSATDQNRGRIMGLYTTVLAVTFSMGPLFVPWTGIDGWLPWIAGLVCVALAGLPLLTLRAAPTFEGEGKGAMARVLRRAPLLFLAVGAATLFDSVLISFFTIFGLRHGLPLAEASRILGLAIIGNAALFYPMGWLADHWSRGGVTLLTAAITVACTLALPFVITTLWIWPLMLILTAAAFGVYVVALAMLGDTFKGPEMIAGSAAVAAMWGVGGLIGPPAAGAAIDAFGINAMPMVLAAVYGTLVVVLLARRGQLVRPLADAEARA